MKNADMPAMPCEVQVDINACNQARALGRHVPSQITYQGLTKREMIAMHMHAALLTANDNGSWSGIDCDAANHAVREADCLLAELERTCLNP